MKNSGFTLIELMITIAIIALLTSIIITSAGPSRSKSRDLKRISDMGQLQLALELYFDRCKHYPITLETGNSANVCTVSSGASVNVDTYISQIPTAPSPSTYTYITDSAHDDYVLYTTLENAVDAQKDSLSDSHKPSFASAIACYSATNLLSYCLGPK